MYLRKLATRLLMENIRVLNDEVAAESALADILFGGSDNFDLSEIVRKFTQAGGSIAKKTSSWLGNGINQPISAEEVEEAIGQSKIQALAQRLGIAERRTSAGLASMLPQLIDVASRNGSLFYCSADISQKPPRNRLFEAVSSLLR